MEDIDFINKLNITSEEKKELIKRLFLKKQKISEISLRELSLNNKIKQLKEKLASYQQKLNESTIIFDEFMNNLPSAVQIRDSDSRTIFVNKYMKDNLISSNYNNKYNSNVNNIKYRKETNKFNKFIPNIESQSVSKKEMIENHIGKKRWYNTIEFPIIVPNKPPIVGVILNDITEIEKSEAIINKREKELAESEVIFSHFMNNVPGKVILKNNQGKFLFINKYAQDHFFPENWMNKSTHELFGKDRSYDIFTNDKDVFEKQKIEKEVSLLDKNGQLKHFNYTKMLIQQPNEDPIIGLISLDITEAKNLELELGKTQKLESLGVLAGGIAHDFNNILTTILGNLSLMKFTIDEQSEIYESISTIEKATEKAKNLTNQLLTFSKGGSPFKEAADIQEIVQDSASFILHGKKSKFNFEVIETPWSVEVDKGQINQVLNNIIINADQAMTHGGIITIRISNEDVKKRSHLSLKSGKYIKIEIEDYGSGIPYENQTKIFDPYFSTKSQGNGLGLATSFSIINKHKGLLTFKSIPGFGTTFYIYLPAMKNKPKKIKTPLDNQNYSYDYNLKILVMDDEDDILITSDKMIKNLHSHPYLVHDGYDAIEVFLEEEAIKEPFDCAILDVTIPGGMGGKEVLGKLKKINPDFISIVSSGYSNNPIMANYSKYGFNYALPKPYTLEELNFILHQIYEEKFKTKKSS